LASNDLSAFGAMDAARECGLRVPDDISIIGFDDVPQASFVYPKLTTVRQPLEQMGRVAVRMLLEQIEDQSRPPQRVALATQLIIRDSCGPTPQRDEHGKNVEKNRRQPTANQSIPLSRKI
jgi:LacI family transcriptional regulator